MASADLDATLDRYWVETPQDIKNRASNILNREVPELLEFVRRHSEDWDTQLSETVDMGNGDTFDYPFHFSTGMTVRNVLRTGSIGVVLDIPGAEPNDGITDDELPEVEASDGFKDRNWDNFYTRAIEYAAGLID